MKRFMTAIVAGALALATAGSAAAAPKPTGPLGNHPVFPLSCSGGWLDEPVDGLGVVANDRSTKTLPTAFVYPNGDLTADPIQGVSMYREIWDVTDKPFIFDEGSRGNQTKDQALDRWDVATCVTPALPGEALAVAYPDAEYLVGHLYVIWNWVK